MTTITQKESVAKEGSLTRRAGLTSISSLLQQFTGFVVAFIVTPIVIRGLKAELYGAWLMIQRTVGYLAGSDLRPMGTLKFTLAVRQHVDDVREKRRQIGAAVLIWLIMLPIVLGLGALAVWAVPFFIRTAGEHIQTVRLAMILTILGLIIGRFLGMPAHVLRGMNLDYKAMVLNAATILVGGLLTACAIWAGWGLLGVAAASILGILINRAVRFVVAVNVLPWLGISRPSRSELSIFARQSGWLYMSGLAGLLLVSGDVLLVGIILGPSAAAVYATTGAVLRMAIGPVGQLLSSSAAGIAGLCGRSEWHRVASVRIEMQVVGIALMTVIGAGVLALNEPFLTLWVGAGFYGGNITNLLLVLVALETVLFRVDNLIVDGLLAFRPKAWATLISGIFIMLAGGGMSYLWGLSGMALGMFLGRLGLLIYLPMLIARRTGVSNKTYVEALIRPAIIGCLLLLCAYFLGPVLQPHTWLSFFANAIALGLGALMLVWFFGLREGEQVMLSQRFIALVSNIRPGKDRMSQTQ